MSVGISVSQISESNEPGLLAWLISTVYLCYQMMMQQQMNLDAPPRGDLPNWGRRVHFRHFYVELVSSGKRSLNVRLADTFASISFGQDEGLSSLAGDRLRRFDRRPHEYIVAPPNFPLRGESEAAPEVLVIVFELDDLKADIASGLQIPESELEPRVIIGAPKPFSTELARRIRRHMLADELSEEYLESLCLVLLVEMMRQPPVRQKPAQKRKIDEEVLKLILNYVDANLEADLSLETLAGLAGVLTHQFSRAFKALVGDSVHRYVLDRRIFAARNLLNSSRESIADIAYATGFSSQSHMTTTFKRELGITPAQFRACEGKIGT